MSRSLALCVVLLVMVASPALADSKVERFELENGLRVAVRPVEGATDVCVMVLFDVGEDHDPKGQSGLAHLVEHLYVTSAAGDVPARTADEMMAAYPRRWNAQTGARYTVISFNEPAERLGAAIREAAARMGALTISDAEVGREQHRITDELMRMYGRDPVLAGRNLARGIIRPGPHTDRKGGIPAEVMALTPQVVRKAHATYYKPRNARLVIAGAVDAPAARGLVQDAFADIVPGTKVVDVEIPSPQDLRFAEETHPGVARGPTGYVTLAFRMPPPADPAYAPFLLFACRVFQGNPPFQMAMAPLDEPDVVTFTMPMTVKGGAEYHGAELRKHLAEILGQAPTPADRFRTTQTFARLLGTFPMIDAALRADPYGLAFRIGRGDQLGIDSLATSKAILTVDAEAMAALAKEWFGINDGAVVAIRFPN